MRMIKLSDASLVVPLKIIFTNCLRCGLFPQIWKCANVVPVHKKNEKNLKENYRPISLLPIFGKILEKLIYDSLYSHLVSCELLNPNQSGFRPGDSTINQLISITHTIFKAFDCNPPLDVRSVFFFFFFFFFFYIPLKIYKTNYLLQYLLITLRNTTRTIIPRGAVDYDNPVAVNIE